ATNLLIQLFNRQMPLNINLFPSHKLNYNDHSIKTFAQHYKDNELPDYMLKPIKKLNNLLLKLFFLVIFFFSINGSEIFLRIYVINNIFNCSHCSKHRMVHIVISMHSISAN
ncbi:MAG: hypothetical protein PQ967_01095, partial [Methanobacterium sp.]